MDEPQLNDNENFELESQSESESESESDYDCENEEKNFYNTFFQCVKEGDLNHLKKMLINYPTLLECVDENGVAPTLYAQTNNQPEIYFYLSRYDYMNISKSFYSLCERGNISEIIKLSKFAIFGIHQIIVNRGAVEALLCHQFDTIDYLTTQFEDKNIQLNDKINIDGISKQMSFFRDILSL